VTLRILADDLTGALDSAAWFVPVCGPIPVVWRDHDIPVNAAIDSGTRDAYAPYEIERFAPLLADGEPAFKKIDSLLRGHPALEIAACARYFDHVVIAPAFPAQGRITRGGRQLAHIEGAWRDVGTLSGMRDAETDADLDAIVLEERAKGGRVLWCGTGGLAAALAGRKPVPKLALPKPLLALIGSPHPVSLAQIAAAPRDQVVTRIESVIQAGTLVVSGGATLRALCESLGATHLELDGQLEPGVPTSVLRGGVRNGTRIVSKSGAFGDSDWLARLLRENQ
jgi:D-threonate/D-erythronate kinase